MTRTVMSLRKVNPVSYRYEETRDVTNSVAYWNKQDKDSDKYALDILLRAQRCYDSWEEIRNKYLRCKNFTYSGHQWDDKITIDGTTMTEGDYLMSQGCIPLENNLIRRTIRNITGVYRNQNKEVNCKSIDRTEQRYSDVLTVLLKYAYNLNNTTLKNARALEQALIGGFACYKHTAGWRHHKFDCWVDPVGINDFAMDNGVSDYMGDDVSMIVQLHELTPQKLFATFAHSREDIQILKQEYSLSKDYTYLQQRFGQFGETDDNKNRSFLMPQDMNNCRVIEVWTKETRGRYHCWDKGTGELFDIDDKDYDLLVTAVNTERIAAGVAAGMVPEDIALIECNKKTDWFVDEYWYYRFITPNAHILYEGESPYIHGSHPYSVFLYPFINGEIHSLVEDVIPSQKLINRMTTMLDWITRASAKGVLLYPEGAFEGQDMEEVAKAWSRPNSILSYKVKPGQNIPQQVSANSTNIGITEQLQIQLKMFEDISGVNGALQGKPGYSTTSGTLYAQQTQNATTSLIDILESFAEFLNDGAYKDGKNILQFYDDDRILKIAGELGIDLDGKTGGIRNMEYDIVMVDGTSSPTYRAISNDYLIQFWQAGQITMAQLLEYGDFPFGDKLLQSLRAQQEAMQEEEAAAQAQNAQLRQPVQ